jgi:argininosuccinate lyase
VGRLVRYCADRKKTFAQLSTAEARKVVPLWDSKLYDAAATPEASVKRRNVVGGTAPAQVARQIARAERTLARLRRKLTRPGDLRANGTRPTARSVGNP